MNVTLDPDTSETAWTDEGYGGQAATYGTTATCWRSPWTRATED